MSQKWKKVVVSVQHELKAMQTLDKGEILRIFAADYGVEKNTVGDYRRNRAKLERFASNACAVQWQIVRLWISQSMIKLTVLYSSFLMWLLMCDWHGLVIIGFCVDMFI